MPTKDCRPEPHRVPWAIVRESTLRSVGQALFAMAFVFVVFVLFEQTHRIALNALRIWTVDWNLDWHRDPLALALDRLCYGLFLSGAGWLLFRHLLAGAGPADVPQESQENSQPEPRSESGSRSAYRPAGWAVGSGTGLLLFAAIAGMHEILMTLGLQPSPQRSGLAAALDSGWSIVVYHLIFTAVVTAALEEIFFRGGLQNFLETRGLPPTLAIGFPALLFGLVHPAGVWPALAGVGLVFGFLFWRYGLGSAILAHTVYNACLLLSRFVFQE